MSKVKIEAFLSIPTCSGGVSLSKLLEEMQGDPVKIMGVCPSKESLLSALREAGLE